MDFNPQYLALITINGTTYEYYGNEKHELALVEQQPTLQMVNVNNKWQLQNYHLMHDIQIVPLYKTTEFITTNKIIQPYNLIVGSHRVTIDKFMNKGGEAVIYHGTYDGLPVIIKSYFRRPTSLPWLSPKLAKYTPIKYLLFQDQTRAYFVIMEQLQTLVYSSNILKQALEFIDLVENNDLRHGDISPGNVMQDAQGNLKLIDFSRSINTGTPFYSKCNFDREAMARVLLSYKFRSQMAVSPLLQERTNKGYSSSLAGLYRAYLQWIGATPDMKPIKDDPHQKAREKLFFQWFVNSFPQDEESTLLLDMAILH